MNPNNSSWRFRKGVGTSIWRWADLLPTVPDVARVSLGEGNTPLVRSRNIGPRYGLPNLYFKLESANPTGSYKDRFATLAISDMVAKGKTLCLATSSGNTGAALAAYCAAARFACEIAIVETAPDGKLRQMMAYGAKIYRVRGFGLNAAVTLAVMKNLHQRAQSDEAALQISAFCYSPIGMAGVQTIAYELAGAAQQFGHFDHVFCPAGGGGLTLAVARGFQKMVEAGRLTKSPRVECVQPEGNDTIATCLREGASTAHSVECTSKISGLQVASVMDGDEVIAACRASGGSGHTVSDEEIYEAQKLMAREEGLWSEPAGAVALAAALRARREDRISGEAAVVCLVTGSGFKDETSLLHMISDLSCPTVDLAL